jgi:hypothetical protein
MLAAIQIFGSGRRSERRSVGVGHGSKEAGSRQDLYYFKRIETQEELDAMLQADYEWWVQYMKDAGAWHGE